MFYNLHTHSSSNHPDCLELVNQYPQEFNPVIPFYSLGIHPWYIETGRIAEDLKIIEEKLQYKNCLAVGECGLDKRIDIPFNIQEEIFNKQLVLAEKYEKPVIIHCVAAFQELMEIKSNLKITVPMIVHGFSKKEQLAKQLIENGFHLSFGKYLLRNPELESIFRSVPNDRFFLETDTMEESIEAIYVLASKYKKLDLKELITTVENNFKTVFTI